MEVNTVKKTNSKAWANPKTRPALLAVKRTPEHHKTMSRAISKSWFDPEGRGAGRPSPLSPNELKIAIAQGREYDDSRNDGRFVYCRFCGIAFADLYSHACSQKAGFSVDSYRHQFPDAPMRSRYQMRNAADATKNYRLKTMEENPDVYVKSKERMRRRELERRGYGRENIDTIHLFRDDPDKERRENLPYCVCREDNPRTGEPCGEHLEDLSKHLIRVHELPMRAATHIYQARWERSGAKPPIMTQERLERCAARLREHGPLGTKKRLAGSQRLRNLEGLDIKTGLRISLAAHRSLDGLNLWAMKNDIYPDSNTPGDSAKKLFANHRPKIEAEKNRISALPENERQREAGQLRLRLGAELAKGKAYSR